MGTRAAIYLRVSLDATGERLAVTRQREDCRRIVRHRGWDIVGEYIDNSISASDKRKARPGYDQLVTAYEQGEFDAVVCWDLDRLTRQPRQLEDWIDAAEERGLVLVTANGEADLSTDGGRLFARIKASVARSEVERKSKRQQAAARQRAELGKPPLGVRLTGYTPSGTIVEHEAAVVREMFARFLAGDSLRSITAWLTDTKVPTRRGAGWNPSSVRTILMNPRYAGRAIYNGKPTGQLGGWTALVDEAIFDLVQHKLNAPDRRTQFGTDRKHLGSALYVCGVCDQPVRSHSGGRYRCPAGGHAVRTAASVDAYVLAVLRKRLARPDLADLFDDSGEEQGKALDAEITRLRNRIAKIEADYDAELIDGRRFKAATDKVKTELAKAEAARARALRNPAIAQLLSAPSPVEAFDAAPLGVQRSVLDFFLTVRLDPAARGYKFRAEHPAIRLDWKRR